MPWITKPVPFNIGQGAAGAATTFDPSDISDLYLWYDASYGITKDGSDRVSAWENKEGTASRDLEQSTGADQPLFVSSGSSGSGNSTVNTTGSRFMETSSAQTAITQPISVVAITKFPANDTTGGNNAFLFDCHDSSSDRTLMSKSSLDADNRYGFYAGTDLTLNQSGFANAWHYVTLLYNGASSDMRFDGSSVITGDTGTNDYQAIKLSWSGTGANRGWNNEIMHFLIYEKLLSSDEISDLETWASEQMG
jgi:hypothetical protein